MEKFLEYITQIGADIGLKILLGLVILIVGLRLSKWLVKLIGKGRAFTKIDPSAQSFIKSFMKVILYALVIASACITWGVPSTSFMTIFASAGVAIGLALQGALSNFAGGLMILFFRPFVVGDYIENGATAGTVSDITIIYTILTTVDNKVITVPNGTLTNSNVVNYSRMKTRRVDIAVSADYSNDIEQVKKVLLDVAAAHEKVLKDPEPFVRLAAQNNSSLDYTFRVWCDGADYWDVFFDMQENIKKAFDANGIVIPYPQVQISSRGCIEIGNRQAR